MANIPAGIYGGEGPRVPLSSPRPCLEGFSGPPKLVERRLSAATSTAEQLYGDAAVFTSPCEPVSDFTVESERRALELEGFE